MDKTVLVPAFAAIKESRLDRERADWADWTSEDGWERFIALLESAEMTILGNRITVTVKGGTCWGYQAAQLLDALLGETECCDFEADVINTDDTSAWIEVSK